MSKRRAKQDTADKWLTMTRAQFTEACDSSLYTGLIIGFAAGLVVCWLW